MFELFFIYLFILEWQISLQSLGLQILVNFFKFYISQVEIYFHGEKKKIFKMIV